MSRDVADGDCFEVAAKLVIDEFTDGMLCHGEVVRWDDQLHHWHAWVEHVETVDFPGYGEMAMERVTDRANGNDITLPRGMYYNAGGIELGKVRKYNRTQVLILLARTLHYGPWDDANELADQWVDDD